MDGGIADGENFGVNRPKIAGVHEKSGNVNFFPTVDIHLSEISSNLNGRNIIDNQVNRSTDYSKNVNEGINRNMHNIEGSGSLPHSSAEINIQLAAKSQLGARTTQDGGNAMQGKSNSTNITPIPTTYAMQVAPIQDKPTGELGQAQQQRKDLTGQAEHRTVEVSKQVQVQGHKDKERFQEQPKEINQQGGKSRTYDSNDKANMDYHNNFPKISNNYNRYDSNLQRNRDAVTKVNKDITQDNGKQSKGQQQSQDQHNTKQDRVTELAPSTIMQSFAARLRYNQSKEEIPIVLNDPIHTTRQGLPVLLLEETDYSIKLAEFCKYTLVGKFTNTMPKIEVIRKGFTIQTQLTGGVKISHYNSRHVYIDLDNEFDYVMVWTKQKMSIEGQIMRIQAWTPEFTPEEETPIVPIWVALPELPWHCYNKVLLTTVLESIGKFMYLDSPTSQRNRGSMARVRVQIDLTKARPPHIWMGFKNSDPNKGRWQKIQYEGIPDYCMYCKHQGHLDNMCTIKRRDEDFKRRKEMEIEKQNKTKQRVDKEVV
ncbi:hypothetical protein KY289_015418 [Solanum tuberosum]|nr:hypothetical protein KY289_015418 [Solanum tuberosum]